MPTHAHPPPDSGIEPRYERKLTVSDRPPHVADLLWRRSPAGFREEYPPRAVNSIYLDSPGLRRYFVHRAGVGKRSKLRIRWYGELFGPVAMPALELKCRVGTCGLKHRAAAPSFTLDGALDLEALIDALRQGDLPPRFAGELMDAEPTIIVRYQRRYLRSADGRVRLTVDTDMSFIRCRHRANTFLETAGVPDLTVLELKFSIPDADVGAQVISHFPCRVVRMSKYVLGTELLRGV